MRLTSPRGTDLRFGIEGRVANVLTNIPDPGQLAPVPDIEVNVVPVTGSAEGTIVADASVPYLGIGILDEPIVCAVREGYIEEMTGGPQADFLREHLESFGDRHCFNVAELGVGLNPNARLTGEMLEDEGVMGTIHIGIGTSHTLGGEIVAPTHYDLLMWEPTIAVDRRVSCSGTGRCWCKPRQASMVETSYRRIRSSPVTRTSPSVCACAISILSNGSR